MEETCEFGSLKDLAYLTKDGEYKLLDTAEMSPAMAEAAAEQVRASCPQHRPPSACLTFPLRLSPRELDRAASLPSEGKRICSDFSAACA